MQSGIKILHLNYADELKGRKEMSKRKSSKDCFSAKKGEGIALTLKEAVFMIERRLKINSKIFCATHKFRLFNPV